MLQRTLRIQRYHPDKNQQPFYQDFEVSATEDTTVLDGLNMINDQLDSSVAYRFSCRMAICGSCGMMVNRKPVLTCSTYLRNLPHGVVVIEPLRNFPVIKDLVVDIDDPMEKMKGTMPYLTRMKQKAIEEGEYHQTPEELAALKQTSQCIKCMLCYSACPVYALNRKFIGPAAGALGYRYQADSRDQGKDERTEGMTRKNGVFECSFVGECSVVCPKRVDPALALQRWKVMGLKHIVQSFIKKLS